MTETPDTDASDYPADSVDFWLTEARLLKQTADLSWEAESKVSGEVKLIYSPHQDRLLRHATEELGIELNLLYRYLIALAIQYLAIGLLIEREPQYFLERLPGHRILSLLEACGVELNDKQQMLLTQTQSAYEWGERYPVGEPGNSHDELRQLTHQLSGMDSLSEAEKQELEALYLTLERRALALARHTS